jgi:hypothetical protein
MASIWIQRALAICAFILIGGPLSKSIGDIGMGGFLGFRRLKRRKAERFTFDLH